MRTTNVIRQALCLGVCGFLWGCAGEKPPSPQQQQQMQVGSKTSREIFFPPDEQMRMKDAVREVPLLLQLTTYKITLPAGTGRRNEEFWPHIRETTAVLGTHELLAKKRRPLHLAS